MKTTPDFDAVLRELGLSEEGRTKPIREKKSKPEAPPPFMDRVHAATFSTNVIGTDLNPDTRRTLVNYRTLLRRAEKFVLDDDAVKLICHLSHEEDRLPGWSFLARLPYPVMWVDFNLHTKVREFEKMNTLKMPFNPREVSPVVGYLLYKDGDSDTRWIAHEFKELDSGAVVPGMIAFLFDPEGEGKAPVRGSETWKMPTLSRRKGFPRMPASIQFSSSDDPAAAHGINMVETTIDPEYVLCGLFMNKSGSIPGSVVDGKFHPDEPIISAPDWFVSRAAAIVDPFWHHHLSRRTPEQIGNLIALEVREQSGIMRWLVTLLASINGLPRMVKPLVTRTGTHSAGLMHKLPFMRHANLSIELPRDERVMWARRQLDRSAGGPKMAWHPVIGHWRVIEYGKAMGRMCRHQPVMVENGVGICELCELMIRWIEMPNGRGDPTIGVVDHTYKIRGRRR